MTNLVWAEAYRPKTIDECVLPEATKAQARGYVKAGRIPTMIFTGTAGTGKTTLARAIANELGADMMFINASSEGNVDTVRTKITQFASSVSFSNAKKITILDEADGLTAQAQQSLRGFIEEFSSNHSIIFTCNFVNKIIDPLKSRSGIIDFKITNKEKPALAAQFFKRVINILNTENVEYDKNAVAELVQKTFPDFRRCLSELQRYAAGGKIDSGVLLDLSEESFKELIDALKNKKFNDIRKWVAQHSDIEPASFYRAIYDNAATYLQPKSLPSLILTLGEYSYKSAFVADQEINQVAFLTELLLSNDIVWK